MRPPAVGSRESSLGSQLVAFQHDKDNIVWGNEYEQSRAYETVGTVTQQFIVSGAKDE
jgi:hypothetical protein